MLDIRYLIIPSGSEFMERHLVITYLLEQGQIYNFIRHIGIMIPEKLTEVLKHESVVAIITQGVKGAQVVNTWNSVT